MKHLFLTLLLAALCAATGYGQTLKALSYNTTNGVVVYAGTNQLTFTNASVKVGSLIFNEDGIFYSATNGAGLDFQNTTFIDGAGNIVFDYSFNNTAQFHKPISFNNTTNAAATRTNLALGATNNVTFNRVAAGATNVPQNPIGDFVAQNGSGEEFHINSGGFTFYQGTNTGGSLEAEGRIFSGGVWTFENGASTRGNIVITNQTATNNGILFIYRTNNEPFLGLANLIASNNTTISNETLFRVGVAEATNQSAQFGFRSTNTNGSGVAVFSVFGYNALMMVGADASTNAVIYSGGGTNNEVMTLIRDGATEFARPIRFSTNASTRPATNAPANTTNVAAWVEFRIGTNSYRAPLYQ
jgi:hypothetical protein